MITEYSPLTLLVTNDPIYRSIEEALSWNNLDFAHECVYLMAEKLDISPNTIWRVIKHDWDELACPYPSCGSGMSCSDCEKLCGTTCVGCGKINPRLFCDECKERYTPTQIDAMWKEECEISIEPYPYP